MGVNRGSDTPASDPVKQTGLQPQVDSQNIKTKTHKEQDKISALDSGIEHLDMQLPDGDDADTPKLNKFKELWNDLKAAWEDIKMGDSPMPGESGGLGTETGPQQFLQMMQQNPNMAPAPGSQGPNGPGMMGG